MCVLTPVTPALSRPCWPAHPGMAAHEASRTAPTLPRGPCVQCGPLGARTCISGEIGLDVAIFYILYMEET